MKFTYRTALMRWPLAFALALALVVALFHDLPALAGTAGCDVIPVAAASSVSAPVEAPAPHTGAVGCHCFCHLVAETIAAVAIVTPVVFDDSHYVWLDSNAPRSRAGLPPFRPPRA
jgi:hypothetical protein